MINTLVAGYGTGGFVRLRKGMLVRARRLLVALFASVLVLALLPGVGAALSASAVDVVAASAPGATYTPLASPQRILDTRTSTGGHPGKVGPNETVVLEVPGIPADATAVVVNVTGTGGTASTFLSLFPDRYAGTSTLNLNPHQTAAAGAFVTLGADGAIRILNRNGSIDVLVDLVGYLARGSGVGFATTAPTRLLDTRTTLGGHLRALAPGETITLPVRGVAGVPANANAVVLNVTGAVPTSSTFLRVTPDGQAGTSTLNLEPGITRANVTVARIGADGAVRITNHSGNTHVLADVLGWFGPSANGRYVPLADPARLLDTRTPLPTPLAAGTSREQPLVDDSGTLPRFDGIMVLLTLTGVQPTAGTYLTAWAAPAARPAVSTVSLEAGAIVPNLAIVEEPAARVYNHAGTTHALLDATGYFYVPARPDPTVPGAPAITSVENTGAHLRVRWSLPDDGGLPMTRQEITVQPGDRRITVPGHVDSAGIDGLTAGLRYTITVSASNLAGTGPASVPVAVGPLVPTQLAHPPGADRTQASAINDHGVAVGASGDSALSWQHAVRWDLGGVATDLGVLGDDWLSSASGINASGVVVGSSTTANWITRPVRWSADGTISEMDRPVGYTTAYPEAINEAGLAAGYGGGSGRSRALKWAADGTVVELEPLPGGYTVSMAEGIGHDGTVVGNSQGGGLRIRATRWNPDGTVTDLGQLPGGYGSRAIAVNRHGVVVGTARDANAVDHAVRWNADGSITILDGLSGGGGSFGNAINDAGEIAGQAMAPSGDYRPVRWSSAGVITELDLLEGDYDGNAWAINNHGTVVGLSGSPFRAVRWSP